MNDGRRPDAQGADQNSDVTTGNSSRLKGTSGSHKETKEPKVQNPRELDDALYAALTTRAASDQARALVDHVTLLAAEHELAVGTRKNKRKTKEAALRSAVEENQLRAKSMCRVGT
jgi:hypothetical protein